MSPQKDQEYLSDGIAEEILNALAQIEGLRVIGRTSSFFFKGKNEDLRIIGEKLGAANLLEGSVRKSGSRIRVTAQLVDAARGSHLWSHTYDRDLTDIFAMQDEIAKAVVSALTPMILRKGSDVQERRTANPEAFQQYLQAVHFAKRESADGNRRAIELLEKVVALDPTYARAWLELAWKRADRVGLYSDSLAEVFENGDRAFAASQKAISLEPSLAEAYWARGVIRSFLKWDWSGARADYERALALDPDHARILAQHHHLLIVVGGLRSPDAAAIRHRTISALRKAIDLDPLNPLNWGSLAWTHDLGDQFDLARSALVRRAELAPESDVAPCDLAWLSLNAGRPAAAVEDFVRCPIGWSRLSGIAIAHQRLGRFDESQKALDELIAKFSSVAAYQIGEIYGERGDNDRAFEWLERAYEQRDSGMGSLKLDRYLPKLRDDPRYGAMLRKVNLPVD
jgi:TolB-like protein